jgi:hypothetical protein
MGCRQYVSACNPYRRHPPDWTPQESSIDPGRYEIAEIAVELLLERIWEKGELRPPRQIKPDFRIVARESTGAVETGGSLVDGAEEIGPSVGTDTAGIHRISRALPSEHDPA